MGTLCLATQTAWQLTKLLLWHRCEPKRAELQLRLVFLGQNV